MNKNKLHQKNLNAYDAARVFQALRTSSSFEFDDLFHTFKNKFPVYDWIEIDLDLDPFVMFCGNDDLVSLAYFWGGKKSYEPLSLDNWISLARDSHTVLDIGAYTGIYSFSAAVANPSSTIYSFEAVKRNYSRLLLNVFANSLVARIKPVNRAVSDEDDKNIQFYQFRGENILGCGASMNKKKGLPVTAEPEICTTISIDTFVSLHNIAPQLIKIDVEGAELKVLQGMHNVLSQYRPSVIVEVMPSTVKDVASFFQQMNYSVSAIDDQNMSINSLGQVEITRVCNLLCTSI